MNPRDIAGERKKTKQQKKKKKTNRLNIHPGAVHFNMACRVLGNCCHLLVAGRLNDTQSASQGRICSETLYLLPCRDNSLNNNNENNNSNNDRIGRRSSRFCIISLHRELSPTRTLKWPGHNFAQITCNTSGAHHVQHVCHVVRRDISAITYYRSLNRILFYWLKPLTDEGSYLHSHSVLTPGQPVPALTIPWRESGRVATRIPGRWYDSAGKSRERPPCLPLSWRTCYYKITETVFT